MSIVPGYGSARDELVDVKISDEENVFDNANGDIDSDGDSGTNERKRKLTDGKPSFF